METFNSSSVKLPVRFRAPAPIFFVLVIICLCGSAGAVDFQGNHLYKINDFDYWSGYGTAPSGGNGTFNSAESVLTFGNVSNGSALCVAKQGGSGSGGNLSHFDLPSSDFRFIHVRIFEPLNSSSTGYVASRFCRCFLYYGNSSSTSIGNGLNCYGSISDSSTGAVSFTGSDSYCVRYDASYSYDSGYLVLDMYYALRDDYFLCGIGGLISKPSNVPSSASTWDFPFDYILFEVSNEPFSSGGSSGDSDLSSITSQINSLSSEMTASFQQVNANIDAAESSISQSISDQTSALESAIDSAVDESNQHFDNWDSSLSGAFSSSDAQVVVDANTAVSGVHQFEDDQVEDTQAALDGVGLEGYSIPSEISDSFSEFGTILGLLFNSFGFVTPLIIFSCTFGIAFVLIGRKSRGSD